MRNEIKLTSIIEIAMVIVRRCVSFMPKIIFHVASGIKSAHVSEILLPNGQRSAQGRCLRSENSRKGEITPKSQLAASLLHGCGPFKYELSIIKYANGKPIREGGDTRRRATQL